jgi:hypothetical protein
MPMHLCTSTYAAPTRRGYVHAHAYAHVPYAYMIPCAYVHVPIHVYLCICTYARVPMHVNLCT